MARSKRLQRPVRLDVSAPTVADAVALIRQRESQLPRFSSGVGPARVRVSDDGRLHGEIPGSKSHPADLQGRLEPDGTGVVLEGVFRETKRGLRGAFVGAAIAFLAVAVLGAALNGLSVAFFFPLVIGLAFGTLAYLAIKDRQAVFDLGCQELLQKLDWLGTPRPL